MHHTIGEITLSFSTLVYFIWFVPQLWLNFKRRDTEGLSYWMHGLLFMGYCADLMYGFGEHMQWQYRAVTIVGLLSLCIEHIQIGRYGLHSRAEKWNYVGISLLVLVMLCYALYSLIDVRHRMSFYNAMGMISNVCWFLWVLPQIIKNYVRKSTEGLSLAFVLISVLLSACDLVSAYSLNWSWPSLLGAPLTLIKKTVLLLQYYIYRKGSKRYAIK